MRSENPKILQVESIRIGLASPDYIKQWAERTLPNGNIVGQVTSSQTVNYKTLRPEKGGLFCERIFGPIKDFECTCGKKRTKPYQKFCPDCDVEYTSSRVRRHRLGYIQLSSSVIHVWYLKGRPSYISTLLDMQRKKVEAITYCTEITNKVSPNRIYFSISSQNCSWEIIEDWNYFLYYMTASPEQEDLFSLKNDSWGEVSIPQIGGEAIGDLLASLDFSILDRELRIQLFFINQDISDLELELQNVENQAYIFSLKEQQQLKKFLYRQLQLLIYRRAKKLRRLKLVRSFRRTKSRAEWMVLSVLPVLPPDLRPIIQLDSDQVAVSDLNKLYQKVLFRNNRLKRNSSLKSDEVKYSQRLLQESVDALIENGKGGADPICAANDRPLKSLSDMLKGKKGRFRQNLLGKRVDYSGRSVIVVGPRLKLHECGLPKELAIELFQPFLIRRLMVMKIVRTIVGAKRLIWRKEPIIWKVLQQVMKNHPVLLNRAPTLHRVGFQAFQPRLVDGRAILLHPLVCSAFNADFDGDQMAVHVPLCFEARSEAWMLMWSRNNLLSPATGQPLILPSQDMVLGCYYLTTVQKRFFYTPFSTIDEVLQAYSQKKISLHSSIWVHWINNIETGDEAEKLLEVRITSSGTIHNLYCGAKNDLDAVGDSINQYIVTTPGRILINQIIQK